MKCPNCGQSSRIREKDKFCHNCGCNLKTKELEKQAAVSFVRSESLCALKIYNKGFIPVSDYKIQSSADGKTELCVTFKGVPMELELKCNSDFPFLKKEPYSGDYAVSAELNALASDSH